MTNEPPLADTDRVAPQKSSDELREALRRHVSEKGGRFWPPRHLERAVLDEIAPHGREAMHRALAQAYVADRPNRRERRRREQAAERALRRHERKNSGAAHT